MKKLILFAFAAILFTSCSKSVQNPNTTSPIVELNVDLNPTPNYVGDFTYKIHLDEIRDSMLVGEFELLQDKLSPNQPWIFELNDYGITYRFQDVLQAGTYKFNFPVPAYVYTSGRLTDFAYSIHLLYDPSQLGWSNNPIMLPQ